jgi:hypothetical protein
MIELAFKNLFVSSKTSSSWDVLIFEISTLLIEIISASMKMTELDYLEINSLIIITCIDLVIDKANLDFTDPL